MFREIAFGAGATIAALGIVATVPAVAAAEPSTITASNEVTAQGTWVYVQWYPKSQTGAVRCTLDAASKNRSTGRPYNCRTKTDRIELWTYYG